jgi:hypothetical protein
MFARSDFYFRLQLPLIIIHITCISLSLHRTSAPIDLISVLDVLVIRVNLTNVLDEGLRIRETGRRMNSKVNLVKQMWLSKVNVGINLACFRSVPHCPLLAPIYRWPGLRDREGFDTDYNIDIQHELVFRLVLQLGPA